MFLSRYMSHNTKERRYTLLVIVSGVHYQKI